MKLFEACEGWWVLRNLRFNILFVEEESARRKKKKKEKFGKPAEISLAWLRISRVERARSPGTVWVRAAPCPSPKQVESCASSLPTGELAQWSGCFWWEAFWVTHLGCLGGNVLDTFSPNGWIFFCSIKRKRLVSVIAYLFYFRLCTSSSLSTHLTSFLAV